MLRVLCLLLLLPLRGGGGTAPPARAQESAAGPESGVARGDLAEIRHKRRASLLVSSGQVVDARDPARTAIEDYRKAASNAVIRQHARAQRLIARKLNKYINKYQSLSAARQVSEADFVIIFKVMRERRSLMPTEPYIFGKLYVVARGAGAAPSPRVVWESKGDMTQATDAADAFINALKAARGER